MTALFGDIDAFRKKLEEQKAGYRIEVKWFDPDLGRMVTFEASAWAKVEDSP